VIGENHETKTQNFVSPTAINYYWSGMEFIDILDEIVLIQQEKSGNAKKLHVKHPGHATTMIVCTEYKYIAQACILVAFRKLKEN